MICHGEPDGHSAMARTVGLPVAIATKMMLDGESKSCLPPWKIFLSFYLFIYLFIEDITRWREDMNFIFEWQNIVFATRK